MAESSRSFKQGSTSFTPRPHLRDSGKNIRKGSGGKERTKQAVAKSSKADEKLADNMIKIYLSKKDCMGKKKLSSKS